MSIQQLLNLSMTLQQITVLVLLCACLSLCSSVTAFVSARLGKLDTAHAAVIASGLFAVACVLLNIYGPSLTF